MTLQQMPAVEVLTTLQNNGELEHCFLTNAKKMLYVLPVLRLNARTRELALEAPKGRVASVCTRTDWALTFRDRNGVYQAEILDLREHEGRLLFSLGEHVSFLARRRNIRFPIGARNPVRVHLVHMGAARVGRLADLSLEGMGVVVEEHKDFNKGDAVTDVSFELRSCPVQLGTLNISHVALTEDQFPRLGFCFKGLPEEALALVHHAFNEWYLSQRPSLSTRLDA